MGQRLLDIECLTIETALAQTGNVNGTQLNEIVTFVDRPTSSGTLRVEGESVIITALESEEIATFKGYCVGRCD
jgi:hypothetical protein